MDSIDHILVVFDDSPASRRALREAAAVADRHRARISVVSLINYERRTVGCCIRSELWNGILDEVALGELDQARQLLGERSPPASFDIVPGSGVAGNPSDRVATRLRPRGRADPRPLRAALDPSPA